MREREDGEKRGQRDREREDEKERRDGKRRKDDDEGRKLVRRKFHYLGCANYADEKHLSKLIRRVEVEKRRSSKDK